MSKKIQSHTVTYIIQALESLDFAFILQFILVILAIFYAIAGGVLALRAEPTTATVCVAASAIFFILASIDKFKRFKGLGIEAELQEKLKEADEIIRDLRSLAVAISKPVVSMAARLGKWDTAFSQEERYYIVKQIVNVLKAMHVPPEDIENTLKDHHQHSCRELAKPIYQDLINIFNQKDKENNKLLNEITSKGIIQTSHPKYGELIERRQQAGRDREMIQKHFSHAVFDGRAEIIESIINNLTSLNQDERIEFLNDHREILNDLSYYYEHHDFRRRPVSELTVFDKS